MMIAVALLVGASATALAAERQTLTVRAWDHRTSEQDYRTRDPGWSSTTCAAYSDGVSCNTFGYPASESTGAVYHFAQVVLDEQTKTAYKLSRTARWVWSNMDELKDGDYYTAEISGKEMRIHLQRGGNMGKKVTVKYRIVDVRPYTFPAPVQAP
ncbi:MAG TPA: hypothetical protein VI455_01710 [Terriglobia bacterium]